MKNETAVAVRSDAQPRIRVWDLPVRLFHWVLLTLMIILFITGEVLDDAIDLHARTGLALLALVLFRILWGLVGSTYARFAQFLRGPGDVLAYTRTLFRRGPHFVAGHNPLGGWMVLTLLVVIFAQAASGLFANDDILFEGPLAHLVSEDTSDWLTGLHKQLFPMLFFLAALHVGAVIWHQLFKREDLVRAMFTGHKYLPPGERAEAVKGENALVATVLFAACVAVVYWVAT